MSKELVIGSNRHETKVAILEEDQLVEIYFQRGDEYSLAGSIHKGRVTRVLPGMQSAFVDLGLERDTFLYVSDFFEEENEDIDTVEERPVRSERRDRGGRSDGGERRESGRPSPVETTPFILPADAQQEAAASEEQVELPTMSEVEDAGTTDTTAVSSSKPASDSTEQTAGRGFNGGDRRGRRSRRRRQHGGGFPENKYAHPGTEEPRESTPPAIASPSPRMAIVPPSIAATDEVLLLPGESLAKYRNRPSEVSAGSPEDRKPQSVERLPGDNPSELSPAEEEEIASEADEIALSDKIFSHHDDLAPAEVEEQIANVQEDVADDPNDPEDTPEHSSSSVIEPENIASPEYERFSVFEERSEPDPLTFAHEPSDSPVPIPEPAGLDEFELAAIREALPEDDDSLDDGSSSAESLTDVEEPEPEGVSGEALAEQEAAPPQDGEVQTASVREGSGRLLHRSSRRMRRRRGGNRSGQSASDTSTELRRGDTTLLPSVAAAAAPAPEPVARTNERSDERTGVDRSDRIYPSISDLLKPGQEIIVQIAKEPLGQKGRAHHFPHCPARTICCVHAQRESSWRVA